MPGYRDLKNHLPAIMSLLLVGSIVLTVFFRSFHQRTLTVDLILRPASILALLYSLWIAMESQVAVAESHKGGNAADKYSLEFYALGQAATVLSALWLGANRFTMPHVLCFVLFVAGVSIRLWAVRTLGRYYSHLVRAQANHRIVDTGPYRLVRHPAYAGMITAHLGIVVAFFNFVTAIAFLFGLLPAVLLRIRIEEKVLFSVPGYTDFAKTRKRLVPMVW